MVRLVAPRWVEGSEWFSVGGEPAVWSCAEASNTEAAGLQRRGGTERPPVPVEVVEEVPVKSTCLGTGSLGARMGCWAPGCRADQWEMAVVADPRARSSQRAHDNAAAPMSELRAAARAADTTVVARCLGPHVSTAATGGPSGVGCPFRRQRCGGTRAGTGGPQARRELRWRAAIGDCCADATGLRKDVAGWAWQRTDAVAGSPSLA
jgi:hypothetical protein